ncbi:kinase-like domain-containing protein [Mycena crocata]|nr:kinase-like domain-containing protein [Mycena crocata]
MADDIQPSDPTLCTNPDAPGEACGGSFDHKEAPGLCASCYMSLKDATRAEEMKDWPQCSGCSAQLKLLKGSRCGTCLRKDQAANLPRRNPLGTQNTNPVPEGEISLKDIQDLQANARRMAMQARTLPKGGAKAAPTGSPSLQAAAAKGIPRQINVYLVPMTSNGTRTEAARILANATRSFPEDISMSDALTHLLRHWNLDWEKDCAESLKPEHVSLRLFGNVSIQPHSDIGTLGQFFDTHDRVHGNHPKKILQGPSTLRLPAPAIYLEGFIAVTDFENSTGTPAPYFVHTEKENRKRKASQTALNPHTSEFNGPKRTRSRPSAPVPLRSAFGDLPGFSKLEFVFASVSIAPDGTVTVDWPTLDKLEQSTVSKCLVQDKPFDQGKTKVVHKIILDGLPWVAKRFFNIGTGENQVDIQENRDQLAMEAARLARTRYFVNNFLAEAKKQDVDVEHGIRVTDFKLAVEVVPSSGPSVASGFSLDQYDAAQLPTDTPPSTDTPAGSESNSGLTRGPGIVVWLFEPRRSSKVQHWSGTNEYPSWERNKLGSTLNAFTHYAYIVSHESTVFCDLQTQTVVDENGEGIEVLFDVMTHTLDAGVGDHGKPGIETFLKKHACVNRCLNLRLSRDGFELDSAQDGQDSE